MMANPRITKRVPAEDQELARGFLAAFDRLPDEAKEALKEMDLSYEEIGEYIISKFLEAHKREQSLISNNRSTAKGAGDDRINAVIDEAMRWNDSVPDPDYLCMIGSGLIQRLAGANGYSVGRVLDSRKDEIQAHHQKHGLADKKRNSSKVFEAVERHIELSGILAT